MKKGTQIKKIVLSENEGVKSNIITVFDKHDNVIKMTYKQRKLMCVLIRKQQLYFLYDNIIKEFSNPCVWCDEYSIIHETLDRKVLTYNITKNDDGTIDVKTISSPLYRR